MLPVPKSSPAKTASVTVKISVPSPASTTKQALKRIYSIATDTNGVKVVAYAAGSRVTPLATSVANIASASPNCVASGSGRTCTFTITTPVGGPFDFVFTTYDVWTGTTVSGNVIGAGVVPSQTITGGTPATLNVTLNSVLATVNLGLVPATIHTLIAGTATLDVYALDADSDVIVSGGFVDTNGNAVTLTFSPQYALSNNLSLATTSITAPTPNGITINYNGYSNAGGTVTYSVSSSAAGVTTTSTATLKAIYPTFSYSAHNAFLADTNLSAVGNFHGGAAYDTTNNLFWFTTEAPSVDEYNVGTPAAISQNAGGGGVMGGMVLIGTNLFVAAASGLYQINELSPEPYTTLCVVQLGCPPSNGSGIGYDATNGLLYYASGTNLVIYGLVSDHYTTVSLGVITTGGIAVDSSSNVWIASGSQGGQLYEYRHSNSTVVPYSLFGGQSSPFDVAADTSGDVFVTERYYNTLFEYSDSGCVSGCSWNNYTYFQGGVSPYFIVEDPQIPNVFWMDDYDSGNNQVGVARFDKNTFTLSSSTFLGAPFGPPEQPGAAAIGPGGFFFVLDGQQTLVQVQP